MLNCNCASTMLLMMFFAKLLDKSQTPAKSTYLWNMFQRISAEATAQAYAAGQHGLRIDVHGTAGSTYLWNMFQRISAEATAQAYAAGQHGLRIDVHGTAGHHVLILQPNGMVLGVQDFLSSLHASVLESWRKVWGNMYSDALVSGPWQGELVFLDVLAFVLNAAKDKYVELQLCQYHAADDVLCKAIGQKPNSSQVDLPLEYVPENLSRGYSPGIRGWTA
eukprot:s18_g9.t1